MTYQSRIESCQGRFIALKHQVKRPLTQSFSKPQWKCGVLPVGKIVGEDYVISGEDDLDSFEGASFKLDREIEIAVRHYRGHPKDTATIYIDRREADIDSITRLIRKILIEFHVPEQALRWERRNDPNL